MESQFATNHVQDTTASNATIGAYKILLAAALGSLMTVFTWTLTYLDSSRPGTVPPSPLSPRKYRSISGHTVHLGYALALVNGLLVSIMTWCLH